MDNESDPLVIEQRGTAIALPRKAAAIGALVVTALSSGFTAHLWTVFDGYGRIDERLKAQERIAIAMQKTVADLSLSVNHHISQDRAVSAEHATQLNALRREIDRLERTNHRHSGK